MTVEQLREMFGTAEAPLASRMRRAVREHTPCLLASVRWLRVAAYAEEPGAQTAATHVQAVLRGFLVRHRERLLALAHLLVRLREPHEDLLEQLLVVDAVAELDGVATEIRRRGRLAGLQRALRGVRQHGQAKHLSRVRGRGLGGRHVQRLVRLHVLGVRREEIALAESIVAQLFFFLGGGQGFARGAKHVLARHDGFDVTRNLIGDRSCVFYFGRLTWKSGSCPRTHRGSSPSKRRS